MNSQLRPTEHQADPLQERAVLVEYNRNDYCLSDDRFDSLGYIHGDRSGQSTTHSLDEREMYARRSEPKPLLVEFHRTIYQRLRLLDVIDIVVAVRKACDARRHPSLYVFSCS